MQSIITEEVRALSWKEPFATLMLHGKIETRTWPTKYRGLVLICVSKTPYSLAEEGNIEGPEQFRRINEMCTSLDFGGYLGYAIAIGRLVDCRPMTKDDEDKCFVQYRDGLFCHVYEDVKPIVPFPWKGSQGWRTLTDEQKALIRYAGQGLY